MFIKNGWTIRTGKTWFCWRQSTMSKKSSAFLVFVGMSQEIELFSERPDIIVLIKRSYWACRFSVNYAEILTIRRNFWPTKVEQALRLSKDQQGFGYAKITTNWIRSFMRNKSEKYLFLGTASPFRKVPVTDQEMKDFIIEKERYELGLGWKISIFGRLRYPIWTNMKVPSTEKSLHFDIMPFHIK